MTGKTQKPLLIIIAGPTGVGKTDVAIRLAAERCGEIISADSMQVYRFMDIGTAKPTCEQRSMVRHHLIDIVNPDQPFNASLFIRHAEDVIAGLHNRQTPIFVVGGTGLYIRALLGGLFEGPGADETLRSYFKDIAEKQGKERLHELLRSKDEKAAGAIDPRDVSRMVRALEVIELTGVSIVDMQRDHRFRDMKYRSIKLGIRMDRERLYERIDLRVDRMLEEGFTAEVKALHERGYAPDLKPLQSLGYKHMGSHLRGGCSFDEAVRLMKRDTRHYAKRQMTWFAADGEMEWFSYDDADSMRRRIEDLESLQ